MSSLLKSPIQNIYSIWYAFEAKVSAKLGSSIHGFASQLLNIIMTEEKNPGNHNKINNISHIV